MADNTNTQGAGGAGQTSGEQARKALGDLVSKFDANVGEADATARNAADLKRSEQERIGRDRSFLSNRIIWLYCGAVTGALIFLAYKSLIADATKPLDPYSAQIVDIMKVVILPVVTFMLGFYFGERKGESDASANAP